MESIQKDLGVLVRLQDVYGRIARAIQDRQCPPPEVQQLQEANRDRQHELDQLEDQVRRVEDELEQVHKREEEWQLELEHFQRQKGTVTNEREFTAVISEIDYASKALNEARQRRAELEESVEQLRQDIGSRRQARPEEESAQREVVEGWERRKFERRAQPIAANGRSLLQRALCAEAVLHVPGPALYCGSGWRRVLCRAPIYAGACVKVEDSSRVCDCGRREL